MELERKEMPARTYLQGNQKVSLSEKGHIRIQAKAHGGGWEDVLDAIVPDGKSWDVQTAVYIEEA